MDRTGHRNLEILKYCIIDLLTYWLIIYRIRIVINICMCVCVFVWCSDIYIYIYILIYSSIYTIHIYNYNYITMTICIYFVYPTVACNSTQSLILDWFHLEREITTVGLTEAITQMQSNSNKQVALDVPT